MHYCCIIAASIDAHTHTHTHAYTHTQTQTHTHTPTLKLRCAHTLISVDEVLACGVVLAGGGQTLVVLLLAVQAMVA